MPSVKPVSTPLKYVVGIAIAKSSFVACLGRLDLHQQLTFGKETTFENTPSGFVALLSWVARQQQAAVPLWFVVEATGVYYEELAYFLADKQQLLSVLLPNKVKHFARSTELKSKTDQLDARLLARLGLERSLPAWQPPTPALRQLRALARERQVLTKQGAQLKARVHAYQHSYQPDSRTLARLAAQQQLLVQQLAALDQDLTELLAAEPELARKLAHLTSIPGVGLTTAVVVVAETSGFVLVENERQLASYVGLDVVQRQSGLAAHATRVSKRGNVRLRTALYLPALSSLRHNPRQMAFYTRLRTRHPSGKPGVITVMRKLLVLCYSLWKNDHAYDPHYQPAHQVGQEIAPAT
ncbi:transposase IS116/IS110/IS902 family protein [Hymenobacter roseosalivarius DSM 11622]|uniref:Transposase IS116/IS110/IS902 family protein n=1 Tax=Hymenobacter roseosalivarius DSM 11622 TaxID=645990 RepID=A0A1W1VGT7_9BACT|nr:IS110 family transposase [Hymenobacter roseosalivarius]SMB92440.1 transposase IS116/IS110/IS902 family protein [Hymenobacter roseosalivarius DSM 11622]